MPQKTTAVAPEHVLNEVAKHAGVTTREVAQNLVVSYSTAKRYLVRLTDRGYLAADRTATFNNAKITYTLTTLGQRVWENGEHL